MESYKEYLKRLNKLNEYNIFLKKYKKKDNITNIKLFYNKYIFISIVDFEEENYNLFTNIKNFKRYLNKNPNKKKNKNIIKEEKTYRIFLR